MAHMPMTRAKAKAVPEVVSGTEAWQADPAGLSLGSCKPRDPTLVPIAPRSRGTVFLGFLKAVPEWLEGCEQP